MKCLFAALLGVLLPAAANAALQVTALPTEPPILDGRLSDAVWASVTPIRDFRQAAPVGGALPSRDTALWLTHDGVNLYIAVRASEVAGAAITARSLRKDAEGIDTDDHVALVFDPQGTGLNGYLFRVNALGARRDALVADGSITRPEWNGLWDARATRDASGWSVEIAIPLALLAAPADGRAWGFNAERLLAATGERVRLDNLAPEREIDSLIDTVRLNGIVPARTGWGLRLQPALRTGAERLDGTGEDASLEPALDALWAVTPTLAATLTLNTDFSDADIDDRVVSLSRFELFRPERRPFFTQDANRFSFGGFDDDEPALVPFFSRRIGLGSTLDAGLKLSGTAGPVELGAFAVQVPTTAQAPRARLGVVRSAIGVGAANRLGFIATSGDPTGEADNQLTGVDWQYRSSSFAGERTLEANVSAQRTQDSLQGDGKAYAAGLGYPNLGLFGEIDTVYIDDNYAPALGYVQETGLRRTVGDIGWWYRREDGSNWISRLAASERNRLDGSESSSARGLTFQWSNARDDYIEPAVWIEREVLASPFSPLPGVTIAAGEQRFSYVEIAAGLSGSRPVSGEVYLREGGFYEGHLSEQTLGIHWQPAPLLRVVSSLGRQRVFANGDAFTARSASLRFDITPNANAAYTAVVQHDNASRELTAALRSRWELSRGREMRFALDNTRFGARQREADWRATASMVWLFER